MVENRLPKTPKIDTTKPRDSSGRKAPGAENVARFHEIFAEATKEFEIRDEPSAKLEEEIESFIKQSPDSYSQDNLLHHMAKELTADYNPDYTQWPKGHFGFFKWVMRHKNYLLKEKNRKELAPLHAALEEQHMHAFVTAVLGLDDFEQIEDVLGLSSSLGNCLHLAVRYDYPQVAVMVERCGNSPHVYEASTGEGHTPLHLAVKKMYKDLAQSPLRDHEERQFRHLTAHLKDGEGFEEGMSSTDLSTLSQHEAQTFDDNTQTYPKIHCDEQLVTDEARPNQESLLRKVQLLVKACPLTLRLKNRHNRTPYQEREHTLLNYGEIQVLLQQNFDANLDIEGIKARERAERKIFVEDQIASYIRSYCMRESDVDREGTMSRLYQPGHERQIEFDLVGVPVVVSSSYLEQLANHLKFESILRYVALPAFSLEDPPGKTQRMIPNRAPQRKDANLRQNGRSDLVDVFNWLRTNGVREIIKVIVVDDRDPPHSDSAIVDALSGFKIEEWDWKRMDLCSDVISESSKFVKQVSLYASANNAVMMGWASGSGFGNRDKFPYLEEIKCFMRMGLENVDRRNRYTESFVKDIQHQAQKDGEKGAKGRELVVKIIPDNKKVSYASEFLNFDDSLDSDPDWIQAVEDFSTFLHRSSREVQESGGSPVTPVKIAIIDDGIDATIPDLQPRITLGATFFPYPQSSNLMNSYFTSLGNHGTLMAQLITSLCPDVSLYIARLEEKPTRSSNSRGITARSAAKAVTWATKCGVDIISMSWTIDAPPEEPDMLDLRAAIEGAHQANILMLCSASDQGGTDTGKCFPGDWEMCLRIGASSFQGDKLTLVAESKVDFLFPGRDVPFRGKEKTSISYQSGSSVATAAASGLAGVLLYCARLLDNSNANSNKVTKQKRDLIKQAFRNMSQPHSQFPRPLKWFQKNFREQVCRMNQSPLKKPDIATLDWNNVNKNALSELFRLITQGENP